MSLVVSAGSVSKAIELFSDKKKIWEACIKAKCTEAHANAFVADLTKKNGSIAKELTDISAAMTKKMVGKDALLHLKNNSIAKSLFVGAVLGPQSLILNANFDLSVHIKGGNLQLWLSYDKGGKKVVSDVAPPKAGAEEEEGEGEGEEIKVGIKKKK